MSSIFAILRSFGPGRLAVLGALLVGLMIFFTVLIGRIMTPGMALLYGGLDSGDAAQITQRLDAQHIPYSLSADGSQIEAPADQIAKLRLSLASDGLPNGGTVGYEIFDRADALGSTDFVQQISQVRALEGELARTIRGLKPVRSARVHLVMANRDLFQREKSEPTASVLVGLGGNLDSGQIAAIQHLVASAVSGLKPSNVSIVDSRGHLLARGDGDQTSGTGMADDLRRTFELQKAHEIEEVLSRTLGPGKVRADVTAEFDFSRVTTSTEKFDPNGQVARATQTVEDNQSNQEKSNDNSVSVTTNLPNQGNNTGANQNTTQSQNARNEETTNYEISKSTRTEIQEGGTIKRLYAAVVVDGLYASGADGTKSYKPRTPEELDQYNRIVRSIIGYDEQRGDHVEVVNLQFIDEPQPQLENPPLLGLGKSELITIGEKAGLILVALLVLLLVIRPLVMRITKIAPAVPGLYQQSPEAMALAAPAGAGQVANLPASARELTSAEVAATEMEQMIDVNQVEGRVRASSIKKIGDLVGKHPEQAVNIMRQWMAEKP
ncbi:MAG TPA: flagellar basal-body MS-ring/collar protein FliF [Dongiaceae bacterium]|jgi:flagellar M-ring protein FliF|nr:flagellar basal-body MS-ring/collar protein FliF [Dongiaceae bacterium]